MAVYAGEGTAVTINTSACPVNTVSIGAIEQAGVDTYHLGSDTKTQRASKLPDLGSLQLSGYYDPANAGHSALFDASTDGSDVDFVVTFDGTAGTFTGTGFVTSFEINGMEADSNLSFDAEIKINEVS